jgi:hypothetical protein
MRVTRDQSPDFIVTSNEWVNLHARLDNIENLLIANSKRDVNGAPMEPTPPSTYDVVKTIQMTLRETTKFDIKDIDVEIHSACGYFDYDGYRYAVAVSREVPQ